MTGYEIELLKLQRFAEVGRLSAALIHEISHPLSAAILNLEASGHDSHHVRQARRSMNQLRQYVDAARQQLSFSTKPTMFKVNQQMRQLKRLLAPIARQSGIEIEFGKAPERCRLYGDPVKFQQLVSNLIINAIQAYDNYETDFKLVRVGFIEAFGKLEITISDWGKGIPPADLHKMFEPFFTTKNRQTGLGLGLSIVKQYVTSDFSGSIKVSSSTAKGTRFTISLPIKPQAVC